MGVWVNPLKKENVWQRSFSDNLEWCSKTSKMIFADIETDVKQEIKEMVAVSMVSSS